MNYYERHLGDYARDTGHLTMLEHGAYTLLMDRYYVSESGIPSDQAHRLARARSKEEKQAVDAVLQEFFILENGIWVKGRIEEELTKAQTKIKAAQENGKKGGRPKSNPIETENKPNGLSMGYENETHYKAHQTPDTRHQTNELNNIQENCNVVEISKVASVCIAMRDVYVLNNKQPFDIVQSDHVLNALVTAGATIEEFTDAVQQAINNNKKHIFKYAIATVKGQRENVKELKLHQGKLPPQTSREAGRQVAAKSIFTDEAAKHLRQPKEINLNEIEVIEHAKLN